MNSPSCIHIPVHAISLLDRLILSSSQFAPTLDCLPNIFNLVGAIIHNDHVMDGYDYGTDCIQEVTGMHTRSILNFPDAIDFAHIFRHAIDLDNFTHILDHQNSMCALCLLFYHL